MKIKSEVAKLTKSYWYSDAIHIAVAGNYIGGLADFLSHRQY
jgi:hypothetical protein